MIDLPKEVLIRLLEREQNARRETEQILEKVTYELYQSNEELKKFLNENELLLRQYKEAVDEGTIVSKTDLEGIITYANDEFCKISGYSREELLGKSHNIVRHDEVPTNIFKDMWKAIRNKESWKGILKNKTKNGNTYVVQALIKPILDSEENIVEYIAIRQNITELYELQNEIIETQEEIIEKLGNIVEGRSKETGNHVKRVANYSQKLANLIQLPEKECQLILLASPMHDVGKIAIPDSILIKPGKLTDEEFEIIKKHPEIGYEMLKNSKRDLLKTAAIIAKEHHEKYDGSGYPDGLKGNNIHIYGRITALVDVFDALSTDRAYKKAWEDEKILDYIKEEKGKHFDPFLVDIFIENINDFYAIRNKYNK